MTESSLRFVSQCIAIGGGLISVCLMLMSNLRPPLFLIIIFIGWVISPFLAIALLIKLKRWSVREVKLLALTGVVLAVISWTVYSFVLFRPPASQPAFPYVMLPIVSWVVTLISAGFAIISSRRSNTGGM